MIMIRPLSLVAIFCSAFFLIACSERSAESVSSDSAQKGADDRVEEAATEPLENAEPTEIARVAGAPLFEGMGDHHHAITTDQPLAQRPFTGRICKSTGVTAGQCSA